MDTQEPAEIVGQVDWFIDLKFAIETGDTPAALEAIDAAIALLMKKGKDEVNA